METQTKKGKTSKGKIFLRVILALLLVVILGGAYYHRAVGLIYKNVVVAKLPQPEGDGWEGGEVLKDIPYASLSDTQTLDLYIPEGAENPPLFVMIHGGGFISGDSKTRQTKFMYQYFRDQGYACASVNYRLAQEAPFPAGLEDCKAAIRFLKANAETYGYSADKVSVFGESAGGYMALMCSLTTDEEFTSLPYIGQEGDGVSASVDVLVDYYGYVEPLREEDLKAMGLPHWMYMLANNWMIGNTEGFKDFESYWHRKNFEDMTQEERDEANPLFYAKKNAEALKGLRCYIIHGDADITVPFATSVRVNEVLTSILGEENVHFRKEPGLGHAADLLFRGEILEEIKGFIEGE